MSLYRGIKNCFYLSAFLLTAMSSTVALMPWAVDRADETNKASLVAVGLAFWLTAIGGYAMIAWANSKRKRFCKLHYGKDIFKKYTPGIVSFCISPIGWQVDIMAVVFLLAFVVAMFTPLSKTDYPIFLLALLIWSVNMHSLFNGRVYRIIKSKKRRKML